MITRTPLTTILFCLTILLSGCKPDPRVQVAKEQAAIDEALQKALAELSAGHTQQGLEALQALSEKYPHHADILEATGIAYQANGQWALAAKNFEALSDLDPDELHFLLYAAQMYVKAGVIEPAIALYCDYLEQFPEDFGTWWVLSELYASQNDPTRALQAARNSLRYSSMPPTSKQNLYLAQLFKQKGDIAKAIQCYEKVAAVPSEEQGAAKNALFKSYVDQKNWDKAKPLFESAQAASNEDPTLKAALQSYSEYETQLAEAQKARKQAEELEAQKLAEQTKREQEAAEQAEKECLANLPPTAAMYAEKAMEAHNTGNNEAAINFYWKAIALSPNVDWYWFDLSKLYYEKGNYHEAQVTALEANRISPNLPHTLQLLKVIQQNEPPAIFLVALEQAKQQYPQSPEITLDLAIAYQKIQNNPRNARILSEEFLTMVGPDHPRAPEAIVIIQQNPALLNNS